MPIDKLLLREYLNSLERGLVKREPPDMTDAIKYFESLPKREPLDLRPSAELMRTGFGIETNY